MKNAREIKVLYGLCTCMCAQANQFSVSSQNAELSTNRTRIKVLAVNLCFIGETEIQVNVIS